MERQELLRVWETGNGGTRAHLDATPRERLHKDVLGFEISVDYAMRMQALERAQHLLPHEIGVKRAHGPAHATPRAVLGSANLSFLSSTPRATRNGKRGLVHGTGWHARLPGDLTAAGGREVGGERIVADVLVHLVEVVAQQLQRRRQ